MNRHKEIMKIMETGTPRLDNLPFGVRQDRKRLAVLFAEFGMNEGVEIGVRHGDYSERLCKANPNLKLTCVDPWQLDNTWHGKRSEEIYNRTAARLSSYNVELMRMTSMEAVSKFKKRSLDFVYIDGNHTFDYVCPDIIYWSEKVKTGGIIACHDYITLWRGGVVKAVDAYTHCHHIDPWYVTMSRFNPTAFLVKP